MAGESTCGNDALHGFFGTYPRGTARQAWLDLGDDPPKRRPPWASPRHNSLLRSAYTQNPGMAATPTVPEYPEEPFGGTDPNPPWQTATGPRPGLPGWNERTAIGPRTGPNWQHAFLPVPGSAGGIVRPGPDDVDCGQFFADLDDLQPLRDTPCINLGILDAPSDPGFGLLFYWLPDTTRTLTTPKLEMITQYLPDFYWEVRDRDGLAGLNTPAGGLNEFLVRATNDPAVRGLFWDDSPEWNFDGYKTAAMSWAIALLRAYAGLAGKPIQTRDTCNYLASTFRQETQQPTFGFEIRYDKATYLTVCDNEPSDSPIAVISDGTIDREALWDVWGGGQLSEWLGNERLAVTPDTWLLGVRETIYVCEQLLVQAALADYYFHWAHRLYDYAETSVHAARFADEKDYIHKVGEFAARRGLAAIAKLAESIVHEYGHISGSKWHCDTIFSNEDCCQWLLGTTFQVRIMAALGLPSDLTTYGWSYDSPGERIMSWPFAGRCGKTPIINPLTDFRTPNLSISSTDPFTPGTPTDITWTIPDNCATASLSGAFVG